MPAKKKTIHKALGYKPRPGGNVKKPIERRKLPRTPDAAYTDFNKPHLTIGELIAQLKKFPVTATVFMDGDTYWGQASTIRVIDNGRSILIEKRNR